MDFVDNGRCFACGRDNPVGLRLEFRLDEQGRASAEFVPREEFQGFAGVVHGGIVCAVLDEAMAWALILRGKMPVTASLNARFHKPVRVGTRVRVIGEIVQAAARRYVLRAEIRDEDGGLAAEGEGVFVVVSEAPAARA